VKAAPSRCRSPASPRAAPGDTWHNPRRELERLAFSYFTGTAGRVHQRTATTLRQREIFQGLDIFETPRVPTIEPA
jgi:hypothetical protein